MAATTDLTPMMKQYFEIKEQYEDCILFFRLGDFYEMFSKDAKIAAEELDLTLTSRDRNKENPEERTPMCGIPYHSCEAYIARLIARGYKVAICEQTEDPALAKGLVTREVTRVVTPGTVMDASMLEETKNNYISSVVLGDKEGAVCFADISTGECYAAMFQGELAVDHIFNELGRFSPSEVVLAEEAWNDRAFVDTLRRRLNCRCENGGVERYRQETAIQHVENQFDAEDLAKLPPDGIAVKRAIGGLLSYLQETQKTDLSHLHSLHYYTDGQFMELDFTTRRNLELTETLRNRGKKGSLLWVLDRTKTAMGGRLIRGWLERPLLNAKMIKQRQGAVAELLEHSVAREEVALLLSSISDLERLTGKVVYGTANGRDMIALASGLEKLPEIKKHLEAFQSDKMASLQCRIDGLGDVCDHIQEALVPDPPFSVREGGIIRQGFHGDVDHLREIMTGAKDVLASIELREREHTGIKNLKVGYNKVFGYYIEVSKSNYGLVPTHYTRRQTLANCERYVTPELKEMEHEILFSKDRVAVLEYELFSELRRFVASEVGRIQRTAAAIAELDVLISFADVAARNGYTMPQVDDSDVISITEGRHPVVERMQNESLFVPNDTFLNCGEDCLAIITGPNMAGKSTYMRQVALIVLMAQAGSFVPAKEANIGVVDRIFTRIGASDDLAAGQSTFMVEMTEVAEILKHATRRSLLILDEIGRGTSTYDGMSIARAVLEYCADSRQLGAKTLFATHYHELTALEDVVSGVKNYNIAAQKREGNIIFLRTIVRGGADQSYGIEVAQLAGIPEAVVNRARDILNPHEKQLQKNPKHQKIGLSNEENVRLDKKSTLVLETLRNLDLNVLTPIEAMNLLYQLRDDLRWMDQQEP
jgi:DNA mismatch repair protein MutS